ncbi:NUDIX domain-containing protein [Romboutsia weinsteinii]|uniref:NUDIX domain-containing protein n=1 Tax=Romboutsia weinsteinii TaxID=2020949 RepID=A0A255I310_9FIRM|nr:NUDIX domain-containing protein [Romboutsia weinsteinii]RDY27273.1 NUDIX domain-containing protein [Romboutsia weinsteinii]
MSDYIKWIRSKVGHEIIILNFAGMCITNENGDILLQKRNRYDEIWGLPGGAIEIGESIEEAAIREVKEETGIDVRVEHLIGVYSKYFAEYENGDKAQTICYLFKGNIVGGDLEVDESETFELKFFAKDNIPKLFVQQHEDMINDFLEKRKGIYR